MNSLILLGLILVGLVLLGAGIFSFLQQRARLAQAVRTEGVVIELLGRRKRQTFVVSRTEAGLKIDPNYLYRPKVRFKTESGRTVELVGRVASRPPRYNVGDRVRVLYDPHDPAEARLDSFVERWFVTLMLVFWGLFAVGMGCLGWVLSTALA